MLLAAGLPGALLIASWIWLAIDHRTLDLAGAIVHENGAHTLRETVLYASHFLREISVDLTMAMFAVAAYDSRIGLAERHCARVRDGIAWTAAIGAVLLVGWALASASRVHGALSAWRDLAQFRTRDDVSAYGSHWHYHAASTIWFAVGAPVAAGLLAAVSGVASRNRASPRAWRVAWTALVLPTLVFGVSALSLTSVRYTGHQARELLTHVPITLPIAFAAIAALAGIGGTDVPASGDVLRPMSARVWRALTVSPWLTTLALAIPVALALRTFAGDVMAEGQSQGGLAAMVAAHVFEHTLDYVFTALVAVAGARWLAPRAA